MNESKLSDTLIENAQDAPELKKSQKQHVKLCWHCKTNCFCKDHGNLMHICGNRFIHLRCLEVLKNLNIPGCPLNFYNQHSIERQRELSKLLQVDLKTRIIVFVCIPFLMLCGVLLVCILFWVISKNMFDDQYLHLGQSMAYLMQLIKDPFILLVIIINIIAFGLNYMIAPYVIDAGKRLYNICCQWPESVHEWVYIERNSQNIRETVV